jgi:DNA-binding Lrp family transcriptional regulator
MDAIDRRIVNALQGGFPVCERPYAEAAATLGLTEDELIARLRALLDGGTLTRFGPMYNADRMGGAFTLAAMAVPRPRFEEVATIVNGYDEVAHNYERGHELNMWFVVAAGRPGRVAEVIADIERRTGLAVLDFPKREEFFVGLRLEA